MIRLTLRRLCIITALILLSLPVAARPPKGFHTGPYLQLLLGGVDSSFDRNLVSNTTTGRDTELALGFLFGWHLSDHWGPFLEARYSTDANGGNRTHMVNGNIGGTYTLILDALTRFQSLRILPYIGADMLFRIDALPIDPSVGTNLTNRYGVGPGVIGGINFLFKRYMYIGVMAQEDFPYFFERSQPIGGVETPVYADGWHPQWSASLNVGFHF
jgi:hypothetical protein